MDKLGEILNAVWCASGKYWAGSSHYIPGTKFMTTDEAKSAIVKMMEELLPEEDAFRSWKVGRREMLKKIKELEGR